MVASAQSPVWPRSLHQHPTTRQEHRVVLPLANLTCVLRSPPGMRLSKTTADETSIGPQRSRVESPGRAPRLWPQLAGETQRQLAQHIGQLVQRLLPRSVRSEEGHHAEQDTVD